ncbi:hypothetical protein BC834DRAFT_911697, partial [Gloeopeniophorella convolvens]
IDSRKKKTQTRLQPSLHTRRRPKNSSSNRAGSRQRHTHNETWRRPVRMGRGSETCVQTGGAYSTALRPRAPDSSQRLPRTPATSYGKSVIGGHKQRQGERQKFLWDGFIDRVRLVAPAHERRQIILPIQRLGFVLQRALEQRHSGKRGEQRVGRT